MLPEYLQKFKDRINHPQTVLLYKLKWVQLADVIDLNNLKILDFGSGFGTTANYLAKNNDVVAIEPRLDMIEERERENNYEQINGKYEKLLGFSDGYFDVIVCHNVLEFAQERSEIVKEFSRLLRKEGVLSVVKNTGHGRIMSETVHNNLDKVLDLLEGGYFSNIFGVVDLYSCVDLVKWSGNLKIEKILGLQTFYGLQQRDDIKHELQWLDKMFNIEMRVCDMEPYKNIALYNHVLLKKL